MPGITEDLCDRYAGWAVDAAAYDELPEGWRALVEALFAAIAPVMAGHPGSRLVVNQVKEKFGGLRFQFQLQGALAGEDGYRAGAALVTEAENRSFWTCDAYGAPGRLRASSAGWLATRCDAHAARGSRLVPSALARTAAPVMRREAFRSDGDLFVLLASLAGPPLGAIGRGADMPAIIADSSARFPAWVIVETRPDGLPEGWRALLRGPFSAIATGMARAPWAKRVASRAREEVGGLGFRRSSGGMRDDGGQEFAMALVVAAEEPSFLVHDGRVAPGHLHLDRGRRGAVRCDAHAGPGSLPVPDRCPAPVMIPGPHGRRARRTARPRSTEAGDTMTDGYKVHAHAGGEVWIETPDNRQVLDELHALLAFSRLRPIPWHPLPVLWGGHGVGKTALVGQLIREARGAVQCRFGCPGLCMPARRLACEATLDGDATPDFYDHALTDARRTTLVFLDAESLVRIGAKRRKDIVEGLGRRQGFVHVYVGSSSLLNALGADTNGKVQPIGVPKLSGGAYGVVAGMLFGISPCRSRPGRARDAARRLGGRQHGKDGQPGPCMAGWTRSPGDRMRPCWPFQGQRTNREAIKCKATR